MVIRGNGAFIHNTTIAMEFLKPIQDALVATFEKHAAAVNVQATPGEGWRSRLVEKNTK
jgi:hypothetical protein